MANMKGKKSKLHQDASDNILGMLPGTVTLHLIDPLHRDRMYPGDYSVARYVRLRAR
jgi:hypothetical protein